MTFKCGDIVKICWPGKNIHGWVGEVRRELSSYEIVQDFKETKVTYPGTYYGVMSGGQLWAVAGCLLVRHVINEDTKWRAHADSEWHRLHDRERDDDD